MKLKKNKVIGNYFYKVRKENNLTQYEASEIVGITGSAWRAIENHNVYPSVETLINFCTKFEVSADFLLRKHKNDFYQKGYDDGYTAGIEFVKKVAMRTVV